MNMGLNINMTMNKILILLCNYKKKLSDLLTKKS